MYGKRTSTDTNAHESSIRMFEVHDRGPIVRFVFLKPTGRAGSNSCEIFIWSHGQIESARLVRLFYLERLINISRILEVGDEGSFRTPSMVHWS